MKIVIVFLLAGVFGIIGLNKADAQIAIAVAHDDNGSSIHWQVAWNRGWETESVAKKMLTDMGYKNVYTLTGGEKRGHNLTTGYWVVVEAKHKIYDGTTKTSYGLGASLSSYTEAEVRAVSNLSQYDASWKISDGYIVSKKGTL